MPFQPDRTYEHVFLMVVDAAGYSSIVASNPADLASTAFDLLRERLVKRLRGLAGRRRCSIAQLWRWAGDGGFLVVHDDEESVARDVALTFVKQALELDLPHLRDEFAELGIAGELRLRVAAHRGVLRYLGAGEEGTICSPDINLAAHLEKATPPDTAAISDEVLQVAGPFAELFEPVGTFEGRRIHLFAPNTPPGHAKRSWLALHGLIGGTPVHVYPERPSQVGKAELIATATKAVVDLGTSLRTASNYLVTTERPATFRDAVVAFLARGGRYRCVLMDPDCAATALLSEQRGEDLAPKTRSALDAIRRFKERFGDAADGLEVFQISAYPGMACLAVDHDEPNGLILASPYLTTPPGRRFALERSDLPHYLVSRANGPVYAMLSSLLAGFAYGPAERVL